jgi:hypothetical protein
LILHNNKFYVCSVAHAIFTGSKRKSRDIRLTLDPNGPHKTVLKWTTLLHTNSKYIRERTDYENKQQQKTPDLAIYDPSDRFDLLALEIDSTESASVLCAAALPFYNGSYWKSHLYAHGYLPNNSESSFKETHELDR